MKKLLAMSMAAMMMMGMATTGIHAAEAEGTKDVSTDGETSTPSGEVYGRISEEALSQMKFTVPIRIDFAIVKGKTKEAHTVSIGDYKIIVPNESQTKVKLTNVNISRANKSPWDLVKEGADTQKTIHDIALKINGTRAEDTNEVTGGVALQYGDNAITDFVVDRNADRSLNISGKAAEVDITDSEPSQLAFNVVYTIAQEKETPTA